MTSHLTAQLRQSNMSSHPSIPCQQRAPMPIMEVQSAIPTKRNPEDDVQFVSVQPVKKARGSRESPPAQAQQTPDQNNAPPQAQNQGSQAHGSQLSHSDAASGFQSGPPSTLNRGLSFPGLENYIFPSPPDLKPSRTSRSSPILSPRQLPQNMLPNNSQASQDVRGLVQPPQFQVPWGMSALYPQTTPMNPDMSLSRATPMPIPSSQAHYTSTSPAMDIDDQPLSMSMGLRKPDPAGPSLVVSQPEVQSMPQHGQGQKTTVDSPAQKREQASIAPAQSSQADHDQANPPPYPSPRQEPPTPVNTPSLQHTRAPTPILAQPKPQSPAKGTTNNLDSAKEADKPVAPQTIAPKGPCVVCEQIRQQILFNQANGLPVAHLPPLSHGWHGQGPVAPVPMGHPNNAAAFGVMPNMLSNLQQRFQPFPVGHLPMGYGMQHIPLQVQMQLQRQLHAPNMNGHESSQSSSLQNQQGQQMHSPQAPNQVSEAAPGQPAQYMHGQLTAALSQPVVMQRPMMMMSPQTPAMPSSPPSPQPSPQTAQKTPTLAPAQPEPKTYSPNLIIDIAETCEELFPWDEIAKRHGVTRVKVVDTFGAIIQLPLLRCATDKKRHGKLATSRLREYTKAKKDAEANTSAASAAKTTTTTTSGSSSSTTTTPPVSTPPTSSTAAPPVAQSQVAQLQSANQAQNHMRQVQLMQTQAMQAQAMQAQVNQMYAAASQSHINQSQPPSSQPGQQQQLHESQDRTTVPGMFEMTNNTFSPLGLPSNLTNGLSGHWQQQQQQPPR